ncbi:hypothetical protein N9137_00950 [Pseudomonadales bacterium]|nr:hypothetical protein [Pseudomonadales bacterium]
MIKPDELKQGDDVWVVTLDNTIECGKFIKFAGSHPSVRLHDTNRMLASVYLFPTQESALTQSIEWIDDSIKWHESEISKLKSSRLSAIIKLKELSE